MGCQFILQLGERAIGRHPDRFYSSDRRPLQSASVRQHRARLRSQSHGLRKLSEAKPWCATYPWISFAWNCPIPCFSSATSRDGGFPATPRAAPTRCRRISTTVTPNHVGRAKLNSDLPFGFGLFLHGILSSPFSRGEAFNYYKQLPMSQTQVHSQSIIADPARMQFQLDFSLQKSLLRDRLSVSVWGRNVLADPFVENYNQFGWVSFPHQTHRTFGSGLVYQF